MKKLLLLVGLLAVMHGNVAQGEIVYDVYFRLPSIGDGLDSTFSVTPGQSILGVEAVVRETVSGVDTSALAAANVNGFGIDISVVGSDGLTSNKMTNVTGGSAAVSDSPTKFAYFSFAGGIAPGPDVAGVREFILGTLDITAPTVGSTTFSLLDPNPAISGDISTFAAGPGVAGLEAVAAASGGAFRTRSVTLQAVPEPSSMLVLGAASAVVLVRRRRR